MKVINLDKYSKFILTVIAVMLTANVLMRVVPVLHIVPVLHAEIDNFDDVVNVKVVGVQRSPYETWDDIDVRVRSLP